MPSPLQEVKANSNFDQQNYLRKPLKSFGHLVLLLFPALINNSSVNIDDKSFAIRYKR